MKKSKISQRGSKESLLHSQIELTIEKIVVGGDGLGRYHGAVIFVPDSAPGDLLKIRITEDKNNFYKGEILEIITSGPERINPPCKYANICGGCNLQHLSLDGQLRQKELILKDLFSKFLPHDNVHISQIQKSPLNFRYRNRIQPKIDKSILGFFKKRSHELIPIDDCLITEARLTDYFPELLRQILQMKKTTETERVELWLDQQETPRWSMANHTEETLGFSQVNRFQNEELIQTVIGLVKNKNHDSFIDLYAGAGNFTFPVAEAIVPSRITAVELNEKLVSTAKIVSNNLKNKKSKFNFIVSTVENFLHRQALSYDLVLLDPPRAGCDSFTMKALAQSPAKQIIYISCHPVSLVRDLRSLMDERRKLNLPEFKISTIKPFEMFPQTDHFETIVELTVDTNNSSGTL